MLVFLRDFCRLPQGCRLESIMLDVDHDSACHVGSDSALQLYESPCYKQGLQMNVRKFRTRKLKQRSVKK